MPIEKAVFAGGCFWGMQDLFRKQRGVINTRVGYSGGEITNATYQNHGNHAEAIEIIFDSQLTNFRSLLAYFFQIHDPTTLNQQGNDRGTSYRSAIYYLSENQHQEAIKIVHEINASGLWPGAIATELTAFDTFWEAEPEHQDYLLRYPNGYTCHFLRTDWVLPPRKKTESPHIKT